MTRLLSLCSLFSVLILGVTEVKAHELTSFQELLVTYVTPVNLLLVPCILTGAAALLFLVGKLIKKFMHLKRYSEVMLYIFGLTCIVCGYFVSGTHNWVFGLVGALVMIGALELSDRYKRLFMNRLRYYLFAFVIWSMTTLMYQFEVFGIATASCLFMVFTIKISEQCLGKESSINSIEELHIQRNKKLPIVSDIGYMFRDSLSAVGLLGVFMLMQWLSTYYPSIQVFLPGFAVVGGLLLISDLVYVSNRRNHQTHGVGLILGAYWRTQFITIFIVLVVWLGGYITGMRELLLISYIFNGIYPFAKFFDLNEGMIWRNVVALSECILVGTIVYRLKDALTAVSMNDIYAFFYL